MRGDEVNLLQSVLKVKGKVLKNDGRRRIDLKRPIADMFEALETSKNHLGYVMEICLNQKKVMKRTHDLVKHHIVPILFYFVKKVEEKPEIEVEQI